MATKAPVINVTTSGKSSEIKISQITGIKRGRELMNQGTEITVADWSNNGNETLLVAREDIGEVFQQIFTRSPRGVFIDSVTFHAVAD